MKEVPRQTINNADYGFTLQKMICDYYKLPIYGWAKGQFESHYNDDYKNELMPIIPKIFEDVGSKPIELLTELRSPHNFLLENKKTLSVKSIKTSGMIAPRVVGQAGFERLNEYFSDIYGKEIENQNDIKELMYDKIDECLPTFIDHLFQSDYTVLVSHQDPEGYEIIKNEEIGYVSFSRDDFDFTRDLSNWTESTTLKYQNKSIAEIQVHKHRTFKFRFKVAALGEWLQKVRYTTETLGISTEAAICEVFNLEKPDSFATRASRGYIDILKPVIKEAFITMPSAIDHSGSTAGERGGQSKCSYDFVLDGNLTLSVKSNKGKMVCPPEVGQPGAKTCILYFKDYLPEGTTEENLRIKFKEMVFDRIDEIIPIYIEHLFDSDWLLWVYEENNEFKHREISKTQIMNYDWKKENFRFTKPSVEDWIESNTVKYNDITIGEFQVHNTRNSFKFRFNMKNLLEMILK